MTFRVELTPAARKELRAVRDARLRARIVRAMQGLGDDPRPRDAVQLTGFDRIWRVRGGDWRIAYTVQDEVLVVLVIAVGTRGDIYEMVRRRGR